MLYIFSKDEQLQTVLNNNGGIVREALGLQNTAFTRASVANRLDGSQVASGVPRFEVGRFGRAQMVEEGTANITAYPDCETGKPVLAGITTDANLVSILDTAIKRRGTQSLKLTTDVLGTTDRFYQLGNYALNDLTPGQTYTFSAYVYVPSASGIDLTMVWPKVYDHNISGYLSQDGSHPTAYDTWQRISVTRTMRSDADQIFFRVQINQDIADASIYVDDLQIENKPYITSFIESTRAAETLTIPTAGVFTKGDWAVEMTFIPTSVMNQGGTYKHLWVNVITGGINGYYLAIDPNGALTVHIYSNAIWYNITSATGLIALGGTYRITLSGDGSVIRLCCNGAQIGIDTPYVEPVGTLPMNMYIGSNDIGTEQANGLIDDVRFGLSRTVVQHQAAYNSNQPLPVDVDTTYKLSFDGHLKPTIGGNFTTCPYYGAYHTEELNENFQNVFTFTVPANHDDAQYVTEGNLVAFKDLDQDWQLFEIKRITDLHGDGLTRTAYCEHALYELIDDFIEDVRPTACSATFALTQALTGTRWSVGTVADLGLNSTNYYYQSALSSVQKVASVWGGELQFRVVVTGGVISARYVDLLIRRGADTGKQWEYGRHTQEIEREVDLTTVITAAYGRGKGVEVGDGYGRRLDFADVLWTTPTDPVNKPTGQEWVGDPDALAQWGRAGGTRHRIGVFEDSEETDAAALLQKTWDYLQANKTPRATYRMTVMDLERLSGYAHEKVRLGDTTRGIDRIVKPVLLVSVRVIGLTRNLLQPEDTKITLGNFAPSLSDEALSQCKINQTTRDRQGVWDRATQFSQDGTLNTAWLTGIIDVLAHQLQSTTSNWYTDANGNMVFETLDGTAAMMLTGNGFMLSNEKDIVTGAWIWRTFGTGAGFTADELNAGQIQTSLIKIFGNTGFYWDGDYLYIINPANLNEQIRLSKEGIRFTQDGGTTWNVAIGFNGILMEGRPTDPRIWYSPTGQKTYNPSGELVSHHGAFEALGTLLAAFTRASTATLPDGSQVASGLPRYEAGQSGFGQAWMGEEGTANLLTANQASVETDTTGFSVYAGATLTRVTSEHWTGAASLQVACAGTASVTAEGVYVSGISGTGNATYRGSVYIKGTAGKEIRVFLHDVTNGVLSTVVNYTLTASWTRVISNPLTIASGGSTDLRILVVGKDVGTVEGAFTFYLDGNQIENKAYATSFQLPGTARAAEVLTIPPAGILSPTEGTWEQRIYVNSAAKRQVAGQWPTLFNIPKASDSGIGIWLAHNDSSAQWLLQTRNDANVATTAYCLDSYTPDGWHRFSVTWKAGEIALLIDGVRRITISNPNMPTGFAANAYIGSMSAALYFLNTLHDDLRLSSIARTDQEIADAEASGAPLRVDDATTYKMGFDGTLAPTVRYFGLYTKNGRFILVDPLTGQGFEVWDGSTRKVLIGRLDDGTIGQEIVGGKLYSSEFRTGSKTDTTYIFLGGSTFKAKVNNNTILEIDAGSDDGNLFFSKAADGALFGRIMRYTDLYPGMAIESYGTGLSLRSAGNIDALLGSSSNTFTVYGDFYSSGTLTAYNKLCTEKTSQGVVGLFTRESPEQRYIDEGRAKLVNGQCIIDLLELVPLPECIEQESDLTKWHVHLTPIGKFTPCVIEIYDSYIAIASIEPGVNGQFTWTLSATRKSKAGVRFPRMEWLVGGDEESDPVLVSNWEDEILSGV